MHTDDQDNGWDDLDDKLGLANESPTPTPPPAKKSEPVVSHDDEQPDLHDGALFDPGPEQILEETDHVGLPDVGEDEELDSSDSGELFDTDPAPGQEGSEGGEGGEGDGGRRKRKRRRRKKKKGPGDPNAPQDANTSEVGEVTEATVPDDAEAVDDVEEGEAPAVLSDEDDSEQAPVSAVEEELVASANEPKQEWNVMTWGDLIGKLYRPS